MGHDSRIQPEITMGIDLGDARSQICVLDRSGEVIEESSLRTTPEAFQARFEGLERRRLVLEVGTHSPWISSLLEDLGHEVIVANPRRLRAISGSPYKSDKNDAEDLARLGRADPRLLHPIEHRSEETRVALTTVRTRDQLVGVRTKLIVHIRGLVKSHGGRLPSASSASFPRRVREGLPEELAKALDPTLEAIEAVTASIGRLDKSIDRLCEEKYPQTAVLTQVKGVGKLTALAYWLLAVEGRKYRDRRSVGAYLGLVQRRSQSGERDPQLRITKAGSPLLRRLLVQCAQYILARESADSAQRRAALRIAEGGGKHAKRRAVIALARRLAVVLQRLAVTGEVYEPFPGGRERSAA